MQAKLCSCRLETGCQYVPRLLFKVSLLIILSVCDAGLGINSIARGLWLHAVLHEATDKKSTQTTGLESKDKVSSACSANSTTFLEACFQHSRKGSEPSKGLHRQSNRASEFSSRKLSQQPKRSRKHPPATVRSALVKLGPLRLRAMHRVNPFGLQHNPSGRCNPWTPAVGSQPCHKQACGRARKCLHAEWGVY